VNILHSPPAVLLIAGLSLIVMADTGEGPPGLSADSGRSEKLATAQPLGSGSSVAPNQPHDAANVEQQRHFMHMLILGGLAGHPFGFFK
jgi:hypothetical protein